MEKTSLHSFWASIGRAIDLGSARSVLDFETLKSKYLRSVTEALFSDWDAVARDFSVAIEHRLSSQAQSEKAGPSARDKKILEDWACRNLTRKTGRTLTVFQSKGPTDKKPVVWKRFTVPGHNFRFDLAKDHRGEVKIVVKTKKIKNNELMTLSETANAKKE